MGSMFSEKNMMNTLLSAALTLEQFDASNNNSVDTVVSSGDGVAGADYGELSASNINMLAQRSNIAPAAVAAILAARRRASDGGETRQEATCSSALQIQARERRLQLGTFNGNESDDYDQMDIVVSSSDSEDDERSNLSSTFDEPSVTNSRPVEYFSEAAAVVPTTTALDRGAQYNELAGEQQRYETLLWQPRFVVGNTEEEEDGETEQLDHLAAARRRRQADEQANNDFDNDASVPHQHQQVGLSSSRRVPDKQLVRLLDCATHSSFMASAGSHDLAVERVYRKLFESGGSYKAALDALMKPLGSEEFGMLHTKLNVDVVMERAHGADSRHHHSDSNNSGSKSGAPKLSARLLAKYTN